MVRILLFGKEKSTPPDGGRSHRLRANGHAGESRQST